MSGNHFCLPKAKKNQKYYYKCNTIGCNSNTRADNLHIHFNDILSCYSFELSTEMKYLVKMQMIAGYNQLSAENDSAVTDNEKQSKEINKKLERLEERYVLEEIAREMYEKFKGKFMLELSQKNDQLGKLSKKVSNLEKYIDAALHFASKLNTVWGSSDYLNKQKIQFFGISRRNVLRSKK